MRRMFACVIVIIVGLWMTAVLQADPAKESGAPEKKPPAAASAAPQGTSLPTPLPASRFTGRVRQAYQAAADIPEVLANVACYCGCDKSLGHRNLLDCFVDDHGAT